MSRRTVIAALSAAVAAALSLVPAPAEASVGLGPLVKEGLTNTDRKGFYLTLINVEPTVERFRLYSLAWDGEETVPRVRIPIGIVPVGGHSQARVLVIDTGLVAGETHRFRVCAEQVAPAHEEMIHARVCSKLVARRVA